MKVQRNKNKKKMFFYLYPGSTVYWITIIVVVMMATMSPLATADSHFYLPAIYKSMLMYLEKKFRSSNSTNESK